MGMSVVEFAQYNSNKIQSNFAPIGAKATTTLKDDIKNTIIKFENLSYDINESFSNTVDSTIAATKKGIDFLKIGIIAAIVLFIISLFK